MLDFGAVGNALLFFFATAGQVIVGLFVTSYAAHCFLVIVEETAAGIDEVEWPDLPLVDWLGKVFYLAWLVSFWTVPAWLLVGVIGPAAADRSGIPIGYFVVLAVWLFFPISLFSSLSANSRWVVFRAEVLRRLGHHLPAVLVMYVMTGVLVVGWALLAYYTFTRYFYLLPVVILAGPAVLFIDARLLGRVSWLLNYRTAARRRKRPVKKKAPAPPTKAVAVEDPWAAPLPAKAGKKPPEPKKNEPPDQVINPLYPWDVPQEEADFVDVEEADDADFLPVKGYGLKDDEPPPPPRKSSRVEEYEPIDLQPAPDEPPPEVKKEDPLAPLTEISRFEAELAARRKEPDPPAHPLWSGVYQFPWYAQSAWPWLRLALGTLLMGLIFKLQMMTWLF
jgi:hypothetical protein